MLIDYMIMFLIFNKHASYCFQNIRDKIKVLSRLVGLNDGIEIYLNLVIIITKILIIYYIYCDRLGPINCTKNTFL